MHSTLIFALLSRLSLSILSFISVSRLFLLCFVLWRILTIASASAGSIFAMNVSLVIPETCRLEGWNALSTSYSSFC